MVKTFGLTHISLAVRDLERSVQFYRRLLGVREVYRDESSVQVQTPGSSDVLAFEQDAARAGETGGVAHFGFRLREASDLDLAVQEAEQGGGKLLRRGELGPGCPCAYVEDPDGYEIEIWYE